MRSTLVILMGVIFSTSAIFAQQQQMPPQPEPLSPDEVTDAQLEMIVSISKSIEDVQQEADAEMREVIAEEDMEYSRFQQIMMAQQNPQMAGQLNLTEEEKQTIQAVQPKLQEITMGIQQAYMSAIQEEGLTPQKFQQIAQAIQTHPEVAERFEALRTEGSAEMDSEDDNG